MTTDQDQDMNAYLLARDCAERLDKYVALADGEARWTDSGARVSTDSIIERLRLLGARFPRADHESYESCPREIASTIKLCFDLMAGLSAGGVTLIEIDDDDPEADAVVTHIPAREAA